MGRRDDQRDNPEAYIPGDRRRALARGLSLPDRVTGSALFADISGFTPLTEALVAELGPQRGAEEVTVQLDRIFHAVIDDLHRFGGEVIYFSGDAITCWLDGDDGSRATAAALAMQETMRTVGVAETPGGTQLVLAMKVAVAVGSARRFVVGDPDVQLIDVLAGRLVDDLAGAEHMAEKGDVVLDPSAVTALGGRVILAGTRRDDDGRQYGVVAALGGPVADAPLALETEPLPDDLVRPWTLPAVYERLRAGRGEFLAELRPAHPFFVRFDGIDYDADDDAIEQLDVFIREAQRVLTDAGGNLLQLTIGDKGAYLYGVFGSPLAHEDDAARAATAALGIRALAETTAARDIQIGVTYGRLRSGTYGHPLRRTFVCLGDAVNLSARLMSAAPPGEIYVTEAVRTAAGDAFEWRELPGMTVKGKSEPVTPYALVAAARRPTRRVTRYGLAMVGRDAELDVLGRRLDDARGGEGRIVGIAGEAGLGKSRLVAEFIRSVRRRGIQVAYGEAQAFGAKTAYGVWHEPWHALLELDPRADPEDLARAARERLAVIDPALAARSPLLGAALGVPFADDDLTRSFDPKLRKTSLETLLLDVLRSAAAKRTRVIVLEDCHWIDPLSRDLLEVLARGTADARVLLVLAYRPAGRPGGGLGVEHLPWFEELTLAQLPAAEAGALIGAKLAELTPGLDPPPALIDLVADRAGGNPFYVEELLNYLVGVGVDLGDARALSGVQLPDSLHSLVLSRIDTLAEAPRRTLKVASVLGRTFVAPALPGVYPELGSLDAVVRDLADLNRADLVSPDVVADQSYLFKHVVTQEVAYESMPLALRSSLHERAGVYLETSAPDAAERNLDLLAHHFWLGDDPAKRRLYLGLAGDAARAAYANAAAIDYYERLAPLLDQAERPAVLLKLGKVLELVGGWHRAEEVELEALALARAAGDAQTEGQCLTALAEVMRKSGRYDDATAALDTASTAFEQLGDEAGLGQVLHLAGTISAQRGDYDGARDRYERSLAVRERLDDRAGMAALFSNLGVVAEYDGDFGAAHDFHARALALRREIGDRWAIAVSLTNLGMIAVLQSRDGEARHHFEEAMRLNREVGDAWMVAISHNNLGNANRGIGNLTAAREHYAEALRAYRAYDDKWATAFLLEDVASLAALDDEPERALELIGAADTMRAEIGAPRALSLEAELDRRLQAAHHALDPDAAAAARARGAALGFTGALDAALACCDAVAVRD